MAASDVNIGWVGYGKFAPKHLDALRSLGANVVAVCNRSEAGRQRARDEGKIERAYSSIGEMLAKEKLAGVVCTASVDGIYPAALELLPSGLPTLLEKPPGTTLAEFENLCALAKRHQTPVMVGLNRRHYSVVRAAKQELADAGPVTSVSVEWTEDPQHLLATGHTEHQVQRMIFGNSIHGIDFMTHFSGALPNPQLSVRNLGAPFRWVMAAQGISQTGAVASFRSTWDSPGRWRVEVTARDRRYIFAPLETCKVTQRGVKEERALDVSDDDKSFKAGMVVQARHFLEMTKTRVAPAIASLESARPSMALAEALTDALLSASPEKR